MYSPSDNPAVTTAAARRLERIGDFAVADWRARLERQRVLQGASDALARGLRAEMLDACFAAASAALTQAAFAEIRGVGPIVLTVGLLTFVFSTILGWSYYGEKAAEYIFGPRVIRPYRFAWVAAVMVGSVTSLQAVWDFADIANGLMAIPNLVSLLALSGVIVAETRKYLWEAEEI